MSSKSVLHYTPEGGSKRSWTLDMENPPWDLMYNTEVSTGWPWLEFADKMTSGSVIALRALIWTLRKRDEPRLQLEGVQVTWAEVEFDDLDEPEPAAEDEAPKD